MIYRMLADITMIVHFAFIVFVAVGAILAWRWRKLIWAHLLSVGWGIGIVFLNFDCPLTPLERNLRQRGGEQQARDQHQHADHGHEAEGGAGEHEEPEDADDGEGHRTENGQRLEQGLEQCGHDQ
jgi:hypothetical protein